MSAEPTAARDPIYRATQLAEVDGNRTRRTGSTRPTRFEGGEAHQAPGHLHRRTLVTVGRSATIALAGPACRPRQRTREVDRSAHPEGRAASDGHHFAHHRRPRDLTGHQQAAGGLCVGQQDQLVLVHRCVKVRSHPLEVPQ
jgi:hypothetical protein